jgi:hypothetical protein
MWSVKTLPKVRFSKSIVFILEEEALFISISKVFFKLIRRNLTVLTLFNELKYQLVV